MLPDYEILQILNADNGHDCSILDNEKKKKSFLEEHDHVFR